MLTDLDREIYLDTDEQEEFIDSIEHTALLAAWLEEDLKKWKWLILSLHAAVQGACVCALRGHDTAGVSVLTKASGKALWKWLDGDSRQTPTPDAPDQRLAEPWLLLQRVRDPQYLPPPHTLDVDADVAKDLDRLNALRNEFIHFVPKGLSLGVGGHAAHRGAMLRRDRAACGQEPVLPAYDRTAPSLRRGAGGRAARRGSVGDRPEMSVLVLVAAARERVGALWAVTRWAATEKNGRPEPPEVCLRQGELRPCPCVTRGRLGRG
jgi:hypothetical protein